MIPDRALATIAIVLVSGLTMTAVHGAEGMTLAESEPSLGDVFEPVAEATSAASERVADRPAAMRYGMNGFYGDEVAGPDQLEYGQVWAGRWISKPGQYEKFEGDVREVRDKGRVPVVEWWYFGDEISKRAVTTGLKDGRNLENWHRLGPEVAKAACRASGGDVVIVVETEFNKGGVGRLESFDGELAKQVKLIKKACPTATVIIGFGAWGMDDWHRFDRAAAAADGVGYQLMRSLAKDSRAEYKDAPEVAVKAAKKLQALFGKPVYLHDIALSSYGKGGQRLQADALDGILDAREELKEAGVVMVLYRSVRDTPSMAKNNYYGAGEAHWGLLTKDGRPKPALDVWVAALP